MANVFFLLLNALLTHKYMKNYHTLAYNCEKKSLYVPMLRTESVSFVYPFL